MKLLRAAAAPILFAQFAFAQTWNVQTSGTAVSMRGISAVNERVAWASGAEGTVLRTVDGGATWVVSKIPGAEALDFRGVRAFSANVAILMSSGEGNKSAIYKTTDGARSWKMLLSNPDAKGFFDGIAFWDARNGLILGDPVDGSFVILKTADSGSTWHRQKLPSGLPGEGAFAASNTSLVLRGKRDAWFGTGGVGGGRVFHSTDRGVTWTVTITPIGSNAAAAGIFSLAFAGSKRAIAVGGDYTHPQDTSHNAAITNDGGGTWVAAPAAPPGYRSSVAYDAKRKSWIVTGPSGSDVSTDGGATWKSFDSASYNAISLVPGKTAWAVGAKGRIAKLQWP